MPLILLQILFLGKGYVTYVSEFTYLMNLVKFFLDIHTKLNSVPEPQLSDLQESLIVPFFGFLSMSC